MTEKLRSNTYSTLLELDGSGHWVPIYCSRIWRTPGRFTYGLNPEWSGKVENAVLKAANRGWIRDKFDATLRTDMSVGSRKFRVDFTLGRMDVRGYTFAK